MVLKTFTFSLLILSLISCVNGSSVKHKVDKENATQEIDAKALYNLHCEACHGMDGTKGISGAANLKVSKMTDKQVKNTIENGNDKGMMPYKEIINSETEIDSLVSFVKSLRN
jgi:mono/diheme cytochrome c family protein